jgi:4-hydroxyphenylpyruvate dioxygenase
MRGSHAADYYDKHGVAVCAIGLSVTDQQAMMNWATDLAYPAFDSDAEAGEMLLPAVLGPSDVLYYFIEALADGRRFYDIDFIPTNEPAPAALFHSIDHLGQVVRPEYYLPTLTFYRSLLGLDLDEPRELLDPHGVIESRTARSNDNSIRIDVSTTRAWSASPRRFIDSFGGAGIQQIALRSDALLAALVHVDRQRLLPMPANYYRDLQTRVPLDAELLSSLQLCNVMYHEDETGAFYQAYLRHLNGLFFELVQRERGYGGYGERDSRVRLAAEEEEWSRRVSK